MLFQLLLFFKNLLKVPTREFIVFNCCSCTRLKLAINELISLRCSSTPENAALNISFSSSLFYSSLALFLFIFLWVLFNFLLSSSSAISSSLFTSTASSIPELEPAWATWRVTGIACAGRLACTRLAGWVIFKGRWFAPYKLPEWWVPLTSCLCG